MTVVVARLMLPDDANPSGNVHGGTILRLMEEAGMITAARYTATSSQEKGETRIATLVRFEKMSFLRPMHVGEVASASTRVIFTSDHSILVKVTVTAEDFSKSNTRVTNTGELWYVSLGPGEKKNWTPPEVTKVPKITVPTDESELKEYEQAKKYYEDRKHNQNVVAESTDCLATDGCLCPKCQTTYIPPSEGSSPTASQQTLCQMVLPSDCGTENVAFGGFVMKLMDNAAGCSAFRHCRTNVVTVAISSMDFLDWVRLGDICTIRSKVVFCSSKSLEIEVVASVVSVRSLNEDTVVAKGMFTFVSIGPNGKPLTVPPLVLETKEDMQKAFLGQQRYDAGKRERAKARSSAGK